MDQKINSIIPTLMGEMESDGENESEELLRYYQTRTAQEKAVVDNVMMYLCGWTFPTFLGKCGLTLGENGEVQC